ncbi:MULTISPECIES: potassium/proton antiporter [Motilimonas]|uniref:Potassium/proton antiporter n=1 Tax=Motilimonas cestriensis TaxID=2742685 RepID=A0ABS8WG27_9GAMM|nr:MULTISPECIES: potassium/proton antiporter [Motilimonas]MCE0557003.1 potassium/proton antiporter [Motilimonas sp. E26]MCE2596658.1 potassium/proton antiporter [Motilimonas cestriensis]MDO6527273.1 potassium/proton antiporter [Motilimonas sp. 1_MG-2023]
MSFEMSMIGIALLVVIGILLHHPSKTLGIPSLLIFMVVGLAFGNGEFDFTYDNIVLSSLIGGMALNVIVFVGGLNTSTKSIRVAWREGGTLSSLGVLFTTLIFAVILYYLLDFDLLTCLLFAAVVSSTDAAAVFSILQSKQLKLKENTDTVLEFESATNDPVALLMVILLTDLIVNSTGVSPSFASIGLMLTQQVLVGAGLGFALGKSAVWVLNKIELDEVGLIPVYILACFLIVVYSNELLGGNVLVAVYVAGVIVGNELLRGHEISKHFYNSLSWLAQSLMFVVLGLQIFPQNLVEVFWLSVLPAILLIFVARPLAVQLCYLPFVNASWKKRIFISAIGLKGATPIVFALIPATAGVPGAIEMMHMVFFIVLFSVFIQGGAIEPLARKLGLVKQ